MFDMKIYIKNRMLFVFIKRNLKNLLRNSKIINSILYKYIEKLLFK